MKQLVHIICFLLFWAHFEFPIHAEATIAKDVGDETKLQDGEVGGSGYLEEIGGSFDSDRAIQPKFFVNLFPQNRMRPKPEKLIIFNVERYGNWSEWSECLLRDCIQIRHRQCVDKSWEQPIPDRIHTSSCVSKHYAEKRTCDDQSLCNAGVGTDTMKNISETCGERPSRSRPKIMGGRESVPHSWPWAVRLSVKPPRRSPITFCGGTLIAPRWILTAAHCLLVENKRMPVGRLVRLADHMKSSLYAHVGDHHKVRKERSQNDLRVSKAILHPKYHRKLMADGYDIALLYLYKPAPVTSEINFACLPEMESSLEPGSKCFAVGWGNAKPANAPTFDDLPSSLDPIMTPFPSLFDFSMLFNRPYRRFRGKAQTRDFTTTELHEVEIPIVGINQCNKYYSDLSEPLHICAGSKGKDTCSGDSGGGLYCQKQSRSERFEVTGITSFGLAKGCGRHPGVYTSVSAHLEWIYKTIGSSKD